MGEYININEGHSEILQEALVNAHIDNGLLRDIIEGTSVKFVHNKECTVSAGAGLRESFARLVLRTNTEGKSNLKSECLDGPQFFFNHLRMRPGILSAMHFSDYQKRVAKAHPLVEPVTGNVIVPSGEIRPGGHHVIKKGESGAFIRPCISIRTGRRNGSVHIWSVDPFDDDSFDDNNGEACLQTNDLDEAFKQLVPHGVGGDLPSRETIVDAYKVQKENETDVAVIHTHAGSFPFHPARLLDFITFIDESCAREAVWYNEHGDPIPEERSSQSLWNAIYMLTRCIARSSPGSFNFITITEEWHLGLKDQCDTVWRNVEDALENLPNDVQKDQIIFQQYHDLYLRDCTEFKRCPVCKPSAPNPQFEMYTPCPELITCFGTISVNCQQVTRIDDQRVDESDEIYNIRASKERYQYYRSIMFNTRRTPLSSCAYLCILAMKPSLPNVSPIR